MSSAVDVLGGQQPRVERVPVREFSHGDDAAFFSSAYGLTPDPWQLRVLDAWLGESGGRWTSPRAGLAVPRQNGKNALLEIRELFGMVALGEKFLHTAHEVKTARKAFLRLAGFFENLREWPELATLVETIRKTNGQEAIVLTNGGSVEFVARSRGSGRGYTVDVLVCDEAQELTDEQLEALLPTISSAPLQNPQTLFTGTPPPPGTGAEVFVRTRQDAIEGGDPRLAWHEWSVDAADYDLDDREAWAATNPSLGRRLRLDVLEIERAQMSEEGFARERLGLWDTSAHHSVIDLELWAMLADRGSKMVGQVTFAVDVPHDRSWASIAVAGRRADGLHHVEIIDRRRGTDWVAARVKELRTKWRSGPVALDAGGPAGSLLPDLAAARVEVVPVSTREMSQACGAFYDYAVQKNLRHLDQPELNSALNGARKRPVGDAWVWRRKDAIAEIAGLVAATLAVYVNDQQAAAPKRSGAVVGVR